MHHKRLGKGLLPDGPYKRSKSSSTTFGLFFLNELTAFAEVPTESTTSMPLLTNEPTIEVFDKRIYIKTSQFAFMA